MQSRLAELRASGVRTRGPLAELFAEHRLRILVGIGATGAVAAFNGLLFAHMGGYLVRSVGYPPPEVASAINIAVAVTSVTLVVMTWVGDFVPRRYIYRLGTLVLAAGAVPAYMAILGKEMPLPLLFGLIGLSACFTHGTFAAILADLFPTSVRFSGVAFSMNLGAVLFSAIGPLAATWLIGATGDLTAPAWVMVAAAVLAFGCTFLLKALEGQLASQEPMSERAQARPVKP